MWSSRRGPQDAAGCGNHVGAGHFECHCGGEVGSLAKIERASATATYEHEEGAAPKPQVTARLFGEASGSNRVISFFETTACTIPESANPRHSAHRICQVIANDKARAR